MGHRAHLALVIVPANNMPVYRLKLEEAVESSQSLKLPDPCGRSIASSTSSSLFQEKRLEVSLKGQLQPDIEAWAVEADEKGGEEGSPGAEGFWSWSTAFAA